MLKRTRLFSFSFFLVFLCLAGGNAHAQEEVGEENDEDVMDTDSDDSAGQDEVALAPEVEKDPDALKHGIGLRLRYVFLPKSLIEVFLEEAASGVGHGGFGLDYVRRKKDFEFSIGFEYESLSPDDGFFVERNGSPAQNGTVDFIEFDGLSWFTIDAAFVFHKKLSDLVSLRYGGGIGLGIVTGDVISTDAICTGPNTQDDCVPDANGAEVNEKEDFFRFPPVFNALGGVQLTPGHNMAINIELGMRTVFYTGVGVQYFF